MRTIIDFKAMPERLEPKLKYIKVFCWVCVVKILVKKVKRKSDKTAVKIH